MKLFDVHWETVLRQLERWDALPVASRRMLLAELKPNGYVPSARFGGQLDAIVASGIPAFDGARERLSLSDEYRELVKVLRAMSRHRILDDASLPALLRYLDEHFTNDEVERLESVGYRNRNIHAAKHSLARRVMFAGWTGDLLDADTRALRLAWATDRGLEAPHSTAGVLETLRALVRTLLTAGGGMTMREIVAQQSSQQLPALAEAIHTGLGALVLFGSMRASDLEPMLVLWPDVVEALLHARESAPAAVEPVEQFTLAVRMEDMVAVMSSVAAAPVRLRANDLAVFARTRSDIESRLIAIPAWALPFHVAPDVTRVDTASHDLATRAFVEVSPRQGNPHLVATAAGLHWLARSPQERLLALLEPLRTSKEQNPNGMYGERAGVHFFPFSLPYSDPPKGMQARDALTRALLSAANRHLPLEAFFDHSAVSGNPFLALPASSARELARSVSSFGGDPRELYRNVWRDALVQFLVARLLAFGGAGLGRLASGALCFTLTDAGRYLLGDSRTFTYGVEETADVVVQPNFDVVFLGVSHAIEAQVARFAERIGVAPGLAFRITRASVLAAAETGLSADAVLDTLQRASTRSVPDNVRREIAGWIASVRRVRLRSIEVIECGDGETALRVESLLGDKVLRLAPLLFELPPATPSVRSGLLKRMRAGGVFFDGTVASVEVPVPGRPVVRKGRRRR